MLVILESFTLSSGTLLRGTSVTSSVSSSGTLPSNSRFFTCFSFLRYVPPCGLSAKLHFLFVKRPHMDLSQRRVKVCFLLAAEPTFGLQLVFDCILHFYSCLHILSLSSFTSSLLLRYLPPLSLFDWLWKDGSTFLHWISENEFVRCNFSYCMRCASVG